MFTHIVLFWLNENAPAGAREALESDCREYLSTIPGVLKLTAGKAAMTPRDVVDNSYAVGLCVLLEDRAAHDVYQEHQQHKTFIARNKAHWKRVQVYDFV